MEKTPASFLVSYCQDALKNNWGYVWSGQSELYTKELAETWAKANRGGKSSSYFLEDCKKWIGHYVADCSGLICAAIEKYTGEDFDTTSGGLRDRFVEYGSMATLPDIDGLILWREGHVAVTVGGGMCIEARSTALGVVKSDIKDRDFVRWGKLDVISYDKSSSTVNSAICTGNNVNIRSSPNGTIIGQVDKNHPLVTMGGGTWVRCTTFNDNKVLTGYMYSDYVKIKS